MARFLALSLLLPGLVASTLFAEPGDERAIEEAGLETSSAALLSYFKKRSPADADAYLARIRHLVKQLGDESFATREEASTELAGMGSAAIPELKQALASADVEVRSRAKDCLDQYKAGNRSRSHQAMIRLLGERRPAGTADVLLGYLPFAGDDTTGEEIRTVLIALTANKGPAGPVLLEALASQSNLKKAEAGLMLGKAGVTAAKEPLRKLLTDPSPSVRLGAAMGLVYLKERDAVPFLIRLAEELPDAEVSPIEDLLLTLASGKGPEVNRGQKAEQKKQWVEAYSSWWKRDGESVDLALLSQEKQDGILFEERFGLAVEKMGPRYRQMNYSGPEGDAPSVKGNLLKLPGSHMQDEDQRLSISASTAIKRPNWPRKFRVRTLIGGEGLSAGAWHAGVGIGNLRVLFHPAYEGGGLRIEQFVNRDFLIQNQTMPFTPAADVLHEMTIDVTTTGDVVTLNILVVEGGKTGQQFRYMFETKTDVIGEIKQISLDRGGRNGGSALFGLLQIKR